MKKIKNILLVLIAIICLTGCGKTNEEIISNNMRKIELTGNLVTYKAYYHNVVEYDKSKGTGITHLFEKDRKMFIEYTGTIKIGIDMSKVKIDTKGNEINVFIPKAKIIGEPDLDENDFKKENFIESEDGANKNTITASDASKALEEAQKNIKDSTQKNEELLSIAQKRAKVILEENIKQIIEIEESKYKIIWEYA